MTYLYLALVFVGAAGVVALVARRRTGGPSFAAIGWTVLVLALMTAVADNLMIAAGLFGFADEHLMGVFVGEAPVEDVSYPLAGALLLPALWHLLGRRGGGGSPGDGRSHSHAGAPPEGER